MISKDTRPYVTGSIAVARNEPPQMGVAYNATIMAIQVLNEYGEDSPFAITTAIRYAVDNGTDLINLGLGGTGGTQPERSAIEYGAQNDFLVVAAAGNDNAFSPGYRTLFSASQPNVLSVGAHSQSSQLAGFIKTVRGSGAIQVDAPGVVSSEIKDSKIPKF